MKYALVNGEKIEATKGAKGTCPSCASELIAKCGEKNVNHWAHKGNRNCDSWWENETDWHRSWKNQFPKDCQEVIHRDNSGEKHIADVKTSEGYVLEFQHSFLNPEERRSRNAFYSNLVWVVNGARRKTDQIQFYKTIHDGSIFKTAIPIYKVYFPEECRLLKEWRNSEGLVFFDFQEVSEADQALLWVLIPEITSDIVYLFQLPKSIFIKYHIDNKFNEMHRDTIMALRDVLVNNAQNKAINNVNALPNNPLAVNRNRVYNPRRFRRF